MQTFLLLGLGLIVGLIAFSFILKFAIASFQKFLDVFGQTLMGLLIIGSLVFVVYAIVKKDEVEEKVHIFFEDIRFNKRSEKEISFKNWNL